MKKQITNEILYEKAYELRDALALRDKTTENANHYNKLAISNISIVPVGGNIVLNRTLVNRELYPIWNTKPESVHPFVEKKLKGLLDEGSLHKQMLDFLNKEYPNHTFEIAPYQSKEYVKEHKIDKFYLEKHRYVINSSVVIASGLTKRETYNTLKSLIVMVRELHTESLFIDNYEKFYKEMDVIDAKITAIGDVHRRMFDMKHFPDIYKGKTIDPQEYYEAAVEHRLEEINNKNGDQ
jgi:hypothetical protein